MRSLNTIFTLGLQFKIFFWKCGHNIYKVTHETDSPEPCRGSWHTNMAQSQSCCWKLRILHLDHINCKSRHRNYRHTSILLSDYALVHKKHNNRQINFVNSGRYNNLRNFLRKNFLEPDRKKDWHGGLSSLSRMSRLSFPCEVGSHRSLQSICNR